MYALERIVNPLARFLSNEDEIKKCAGLFALIFGSLLVLLVVRPNAGMMGLSGFVSLIIALVIASLTSFAIVRFFLEPVITEMKHDRSISNYRLASTREQSDRHEETLQKLNTQKQIIDQHCVVSESDAEGKFTYVNDAFCKITGYSRKEILGKDHSMINVEEVTQEFWEKMYDTVSKGGVWQSEVCNRRKDGTTFWLVQTIAALKDSDGNLTGYIDIGADITELKSLQEEIIRKSKLAQLGQLTSTIAHEIRNPMGAVKTGAYLVQKKIEKSGIELDLSAQCERINNGVERCDSIITQLLDFSRTRLIDGKNIEIDAWLKGVMDEIQDDVPDNVVIECQFGAAGREAIIGKEQLRRVIVNHVSNSVEAMVGKGSDVPENPTHNPRIIVSTQMDGPNIEITVADNGPGITPDDLKKIRDPLYSTKSFGVGLGIPAVEKILENHGGGLRIDTKEGHGARMISWFPAVSLSDKEAA